MDGLSRDDVQKIAKLARLRLADDEADDARTRLDAVLGYMERLQQLNLDGVEPLTHVAGETNRLDPDEPAPCLPTDALMNMAPETEPPFVKVPKVLGDGGGA